MLVKANSIFREVRALQDSEAQETFLALQELPAAGCPESAPSRGCWSQATCMGILAQPLTSCVTLGTILNPICAPVFSFEMLK